MSAITAASLVVTYGTTFVAWTFIVLYHVLTRGAWRRDPMGRHLMALAGVDAGIFTMLTLANMWPILAIEEWYLWAYICMVAGIMLVTGWRAVILWRLYHPRKRPFEESS